MLDAVTHGCIPVVIQDESEMFLEGAFTEAGLPLDYASFSLRLMESDLPRLVKVLRAVPPARIRELRRAALWARDYFVYKDMYNPSASSRTELLGAGRPGQDAFLLITLALEGRARSLGKLIDAPDWRQRNLKLLGWGAAASTVEGVAGRVSEAAADAADKLDAVTPALSGPG